MLLKEYVVKKLANRNKLKENNVLVPNFRKANFKGLNDALKRTNHSINLAQAVHLSADQNEQGRMQVSSGSVNVAYNNFITSLQDKQSEFIPKRKLRSNSNQSKWMTYKLLYIIGRKKGVYRKIQKGGTHLKSYYHILKRQAKAETKKAKRNYEIKVASESKITQRPFIKCTKPKLKIL